MGAMQHVGLGFVRARFIAAACAVSLLAGCQGQGPAGDSRGETVGRWSVSHSSRRTSSSSAVTRWMLIVTSAPLARPRIAPAQTARLRCAVSASLQV